MYRSTQLEKPLAVAASANRKEEDSPIFTFNRFEPVVTLRRENRLTEIAHMVVSNNTLVIASNSGTLYRTRFDVDLQPERILMATRDEDSVAKLCMDPTGVHLFVFMNSGEAYYINCSTASPKPKKLARMQALGVTAIGFDQSVGMEQSGTFSSGPSSVGGASPAALTTKPFLIGTVDGKLFECVIDTITGKEKVLNQVFCVSDNYPISDIHVECVGECQYPASSSTSSTSTPASSSGLSLLTSVPSAASSALASFAGKMTGDSSASLANTAAAIVPGLVFYIIITTAAPVRIHHFIGGPTFETLFVRYANNDMNYTQLGSVDKCQIRCYRRNISTKPDFFACKTDKGVYHGSLLIPSFTNSSSFSAMTTPGAMIFESGLSDYPPVQAPLVIRKTTASSQAANVPTGIEITEFHFLMIGAFGFVAMSRLDSTRVTQTSGCDRFDDVAPIAIACDPTGQTLWLCTKLNVYQIVKNNEDKHMWSTYLDWALTKKGERHFDSAYQFCKTAEQRDAVTTLRANYHMEQGDYEKAALYFGKVTPSPGLAMTSSSSSASGRAAALPSSSSSSLERYAKVPPFELICIRFLDKQQRSALRIYLRERLKFIPQGQKIQRTMICTWMVEMFLGELNEKEILRARVAGSLSVLRSKLPVRQSIRISNNNNNDDVGITNEIEQLSIKSEKLSEDILRLSQELVSFLFDFRFNLETNTTLSLLSSHGRRSELLGYARHMDSPDKVIKMLIYSKDYAEAIRFFSIEPLSRTTDLIYAYAPELMANMPEMTTEMLKKKIMTQYREATLDIRMLLPTLFVYRELIHASSTDGKSLRKSKFNEMDAEPHLVSTKLVLDCSIRLLESVSFDESKTRFSSRPMDLVPFLVLIVLYSESGCEDDIVSLFRLMASSATEFDKSRLLPSDIGLVLTYCNRMGLWRSVVHALALTGKYEAAVDCALSNSRLYASSVSVDKSSRIDLAKLVINNYAIKMISSNDSLLSRLRFGHGDDSDDDDDGHFGRSNSKNRNDDDDNDMLDSAVLGGGSSNGTSTVKPSDDSLRQVFAIGGTGHDRLTSVLDSIGLKSLIPSIGSKDKDADETKASGEAFAIDDNSSKPATRVRMDMGLSICKSLWLKVAQFIVSSKYSSGASSADDIVEPLLSLIKESSKILSVEDILPLLPNETEIDLIRNKIVKTLNNYNRKVSDLRKEVEQSALTCQSIAREIDDMQNRGMTMSSKQQCPLCAKEVLQRNIYLFPCSHAFHEDCLSSFVVSLMDSQQKDAVKELGKQIFEVRRQLADVYRLLESQGRRVNLTRQETKLTQKIELLQEELDGYLAAECPLCGLVMIQSVGTQLVAMEDIGEAMKWEI